MAEKYYSENSCCFIDVPIELLKQKQSAEFFISIYIDNLIKKFRCYNDDKYTIGIGGLGCFIDSGSNTISYLCKRLSDNNFFINLTGSKKHTGEAEVTCTNNSKSETYSYTYQVQNLPSIIDLSSKTDIPIIGIIIMKIVVQTIVKQKILYKAMVFDLDDTLWKGTLAEDGREKIKEVLNSDAGIPFISFMNFIKVLANELGIFIAICSRNDVEQVKLAIEGLDESIFPLKNQIDCLIANYNDKSENLKEIATQLSILPQSVIFIDDNQIIRDEVKQKLPDVFVPQWTNHSELITQLIVGCFFERNELSINSQKRRHQFEILQTERKANDLPELLIKVFEDEKHKEAMELYAKSNQFKFSQQNGNFDDQAKSIYFELYRKNGESLGICSTLTFCKYNDKIEVLNWAISCRYFEIGLEEFILNCLQNVLNAKKVSFHYQKTEYNNKVGELLNKYPNSFNKDATLVEFEYTQESVNKLISNTNLKQIKNG